MYFTFSSFFWGFFLILLGISFIMKILFNIRIHTIKLFIAVLIISIGVRLFLKSISPRILSNTVILETKFFNKEIFFSDYLILFGKGDLDLTNYDLSRKKVKKIKIITILGKLNLHYDVNYPIKIKVNNLFSSSQLVEQNINIVGKANVKTPSYDPFMEHLNLDIVVIFGEVNLNR